MFCSSHQTSPNFQSVVYQKSFKIQSDTQFFYKFRMCRASLGFTSYRVQNFFFPKTVWNSLRGIFFVVFPLSVGKYLKISNFTAIFFVYYKRFADWIWKQNLDAAEKITFPSSKRNAKNVSTSTEVWKFSYFTTFIKVLHWQF